MGPHHRHRQGQTLSPTRIESLQPVQGNCPRSTERTAADLNRRQRREQRRGFGRLRALAVSRILAASMSNRIVIDPRICHGKPVIRGTRTPVAIVVSSLAGGMSFEDVQREYELTIEDIRAALKFAGELVEQEQHHPLPA